MDRKTLEIAKRFAGRLRKKYSVDRIVLFGSRARGDSFQSSDFDFLIVSANFEGKRFAERAPDIYRYWNEDYALEPLCYTPREFREKRRQIGVVRKALKEGIAV